MAELTPAAQKFKEWRVLHKAPISAIIVKANELLERENKRLKPARVLDWERGEGELDDWEKDVITQVVSDWRPADVPYWAR